MSQPFPEPVFSTDLGTLYSCRCEELFPHLASESMDMVFADPPFNIKKSYRENCTDNMPEGEYVEWSKNWLTECVRLLKPGGAMFLYHLPRWNMRFGSHLEELGLTFRHWIAIELNVTMPRPLHLYPSHYSLLYMTKGKPKHFGKLRTPIQTCRHCHGEIKDYGGHRNKMHVEGVNLKDVWTDITPVRHAKYKHHGRKGVNALSTTITDRAVQIATAPGDLVFDPFGGSGTTYISAEQLGRRWIGAEVDYCPEIIDRFNETDVRPHLNLDKLLT
jgi:site-specific DNA-methyltransferase (adenine-specific)